MELKTLRLTLDAAPNCSVCQGTTISEPGCCGDLSVPWKLVSIPDSEIDIEWLQEELNSKICIVRKCDGEAFEVAVEPSYLAELQDCQLPVNADYDPTQPSEAEANIFGIWEARRKARERWLQQVVQVISSKHSLEVHQAYRDLTESRGWRRELDRTVLIHDICESPAPVQRKLAQNLVFLFLNLEANHSSRDAQNLLSSNQDELLDGLKSGLRIPVPQKRPRRDESQITSLFWALLELSGGKLDLQQHNFAEEYTANHNSDLYASIFDITRTNDFGEFDGLEMRRTMAKSPVFSGEEMSVQVLEDWSTIMKASLYVGFRHGYLNLPTQVLRGLGVGQVNMFYAYLVYVYNQLPELADSENNVLLLLTWSTSVSAWSEQHCGRPFEVLEEWAQSQDGWNVYLRLVTDFQGRQSIARLALIMAAMMNYRRLCPDFLDNSEQPITGSYVADLDALLGGFQLGNSGRVAERMVFALARELRASGEDFEDLNTFLETALDRNYPPLHVSEGFCDEYIRLRRNGQFHGAAITDLAGLRLPALRGTDNTDLSLPLLIPRDCYTLIRVTNIQDEKALDLLYKKLGKAIEVPRMQKLGDGSLEICILKSRSHPVQETIRNILPDSHVDRSDLTPMPHDLSQPLRAHSFGYFLSPEPSSPRDRGSTL